LGLSGRGGELCAGGKVKVDHRRERGKRWWPEVAVEQRTIRIWWWMSVGCSRADLERGAPRPMRVGKVKVDRGGEGR
jgi:hypothetical protein